MTVSDSSTTPASVPVIWGNVPQRNKNFTGRADIFAQLRPVASRKVTAVLPGDPLPQALQGLGGVGKTAVAIEYAYRYRSEYELVWWIPADQKALVRPSLAALAGRLGLEAASATGIDNAAAAVLDALRRGDPYHRWLLIFDNADQPEDLKDVIPDGPGDVLITSRNHRWQSVVDTLQVDVFARAESTEFLSKRVLKGLTESDADRIADQLGDLPLALEQAGALLAETGMPVDEYLRLLDEHVTQIMAEGKSVDYPESMTAAWMIQVAAVREQLPQALELLRCCAFFGPDPIPRDVFRRGTRATGTRVSDLIANPILLARAIRELGRFALVKIDGRTIVVHRLIQALLRDELDADERNSYQHEVHLILAAGAPADPTENRQWSRFGELVAHVASGATDLARCQDPGVRAFALTVVRYLYLSGDIASCRLFAERFIEQWTADSGADDPAVLDAQLHLGNAVRQLGQYAEAYSIDEPTLSSAREVLGAQSPLTLSLRRSVAADLRASGDFVNARAMDEETRSLYEAEFGPTDPETLRSMNNLALDYALNSDYFAARELHERAYLLMSEAATGVSPTEVLASWNGLARDVRLCGNYIEARDVGEDARDFGREVLGPEHYWTLRTANDLVIALRRTALEFDDALTLAEEVFEACTRIHGDQHPDTLSAAICLANILRTTDRRGEALELAERTVDRYPQVYGADHPYNYGFMGNLALLRRVTGDLDGAAELNESALAGLDSKLTRDHHYSLTVALNLASDHAAREQPEKARELGEDTLPRLRRLLGENHPVALGCAANLAVDLRASKATEDAERLSAGTMRRYAATLGMDHPDAVAAAAGRRLDFDFEPPPI